MIESNWAVSGDCLLCGHEVEGVGRESDQVTFLLRVTAAGHPQPPVQSVSYLLCSRSVAVFGLVYHRGMSAPSLTHLSPVVLITVRTCQLAFSILEPSGVSSTWTPPHHLCVDISDTPVELSCTHLSQPCRTAGLFWMPFPLSFLFCFWRLKGISGL